MRISVLFSPVWRSGTVPPRMGAAPAAPRRGARLRSDVLGSRSRCRSRMLGDLLVQGAVVEAGEAAVAETLAWLEREACHVCRGTTNRHAKVPDVEMWDTVPFPGAGFVAAAFRHRTSRAGDPQLHWHVLVANTTRGPDGKWRTLDGTRLYPAMRTAGFLFEAELRHHLTARFGVRVGSTGPQRDRRDRRDPTRAAPGVLEAAQPDRGPVDDHRPLDGPSSRAARRLRHPLPQTRGRTRAHRPPATLDERSDRRRVRHP